MRHRGRAIEILQEQRIDLAVVNIRLPNRTGMALMSWIRERGLDLPVIVVSGDDSIEAAIAALRCGAFEYVRKPFDAALLRRRSTMR